MPKINRDTLGSLWLPVPPVREQDAIAGFLDERTATIDTLLEKKRALVGALCEKRQALISRVVTRGLPRGLEPAAVLSAGRTLQNARANWLGAIPESWPVLRLKMFLVRIEQGWSPQCDNAPAAEDEWGVLKVGAVNGWRFDPSENKALPAAEEPLAAYEIRAGDLLVSRANTRELLGSAALVGNVRPKLLLCDKLYRLGLRAGAIDPAFVLYFLRSKPGRFMFERDATGSSSSMQNIGQESVRDLWLPVPPLGEQRAIVRYLDEHLAVLSRMIATAEEAIERLQEYRAALVTAAVTGRINARQIASDSQEIAEAVA